MIAGLSQRVESPVRELDRQSVASGTERFIAFLLQHDRGETGLVLTLPAAKAEIASQLNLTPEHVSRILPDLAQTGPLKTQGRRSTVPDTDRLRRPTRKT